MLLDEVAAMMERYAMVRPGGCLLAAVSGGADSVAMLYLLQALQPRLHFRLEAVHFEHGIRGETSKADARFVAQLCQSLQIPLHLGEGNVPALAAQWHCGLEDAARRARYSFFKQAMHACGAQTTALAHHMEDQAETVLLHMTRGCGLTGLCGMRFVQGVWVRPLLGQHRDVLRAYVREKGISWREDETNAIPDRPRTFLRHQVIPALLQINPMAIDAMTQMTALLQREEDDLQAQMYAKLAGHYRETPYGGFLETEEAFAWSPAVQGRALRFLTRAFGAPPLSAEQTERMSTWLMGKTTGLDNLSQGFRVQRTARRLHWLSPKEAMSFVPQPVWETGMVALAGVGCLRMERSTGSDYGDGFHTQALDAEKLVDCVLRTPRPGDRIHPLGAPGHMKLSDYWINHHVDRPFRSYMPVLACQDRILWAIGVGVAADAAVTLETRRVAYASWKSPFLWEIT